VAKHSIIYAWLILTLIVSLPSFANNIDPVNPTKTLNVPKLEFLKNYEGQNEIKILNNRFRVDYHVKEVMLLFFRKHGSKPIVLIQPDGSKIYPKDANAKTIEWHADISYDLIKLQDPMPGPWQAVGRILADSKILVLSDIELQADLFPSLMFQHEIIKAEARVINANEMIKAKSFNEVITLKASLYPSKDPEKENFGSDIYQFGEFLDNGKGLDERPRDGVFTIEYKIDTGYGEWIPNYRVNAQLFTRELEQEPVIILPSPVSFTAIPAEINEESGEVGRYHYVTFNVDDTYVDNLSLLFQGTIKFPNGDKQTFSIDGLQERRLEIFNGEFGTFKVEMDVFGTTKDGREIYLDLPEFQFVTVEPEIEYIELPEMTEMDTVVKKVAPPEPDFPLPLIILMNVLILAFGFLVIWLFVLKRNIKNPFAGLIKKKEKKPVEPETVEKPKTEKPEKKSPIVDESDDILDLSLPED